MNMRIYGLDFTSKPKKGKPLTLAICTLKEKMLTVEVEKLHEFEPCEPLKEYSNWLNGKGDWENEKEWVAGIDFPFGMPIPAIIHFEWADDIANTSWCAYMKKLFEDNEKLFNFKKIMENWAYPNEKSEKGRPVKIQFKRLTDHVAHSQSPMKVSDNPYPGAMLYQGCKALLEANVSVPPLRRFKENEGKIVVEAYPRIVAQTFLTKQTDFNEVLSKKAEKESLRKQYKKSNATEEGLEKEIADLSSQAKHLLRYKEAKDDTIPKANRALIIQSLENPKNPYQIQLRFRTNCERDRCVNDPKGDLLDSVLCAVQAAWSFNNRESNWGIPTFKNDVLQKQVALEGWIADPALHGHFPLRESEA